MGAGIAVGVDLVEVDRVARILARHPDRFPERYFTPRERADCRASPARLAARWAAKEAAAKALGTGLGPVGARDVEVVRGECGAPQLELHGAARVRARSCGFTHWSVSLSHTSGHAMAVVVALVDHAPVM